MQGRTQLALSEVEGSAPRERSKRLRSSNSIVQIS
jgi:hypothetical protein